MCCQGHLDLLINKIKKNKKKLLAHSVYGRCLCALRGSSWCPKRPTTVSFDGLYGGASNGAKHIRCFTMVTRWFSPPAPLYFTKKKMLAQPRLKVVLYFLFISIVTLSVFIILYLFWIFYYYYLSISSFRILFYLVFISNLVFIFLIFFFSISYPIIWFNLTFMLDLTLLLLIIIFCLVFFFKYFLLIFNFFKIKLR